MDFQAIPFDSHQCNLDFKNWIGSIRRINLKAPKILVNDENGQEMFQFSCVENCQCLTFLPSFQFLSSLFPAQTWECCASADEVAQARLHYVERCPPLAARAHAREEADVEIKIAWEVGDAGTELDLSLMHLRRYTCHNHQLLLEICLSMHERLL